MNAIKATFKNRVGNIFIVSFIVTGVICYVQWTQKKPTTNVVKAPPIHDTVKITDTVKVKSNERSIQPIRRNAKTVGMGNVVLSKKKIDTITKAKNLVTAPNYGNQQVGDNNTQNNFGKLDHHPQQGDIDFITHYLHDKTKKIVLAYETPDSDSANYCKELKSLSEQYGYQVELFGHLNIGMPPQEHKVMVDTVNYRVSVEWNYN